MKSDPILGIGLRRPHYDAIISEDPKEIDWVEVHSENFFMQGGPALNLLTEVRKKYPISLHGIGLSLGSAEGLDTNHLLLLKNLIESIDPFLVSEHLSWGKIGQTYLHDLLPIPYNDETMQVFCQNINIAQDYLQREILIENPSSYIEFTESTYGEAEFLTTVAEKTGAKILLDVNNIYVSCFNHGWNTKEYLGAIPTKLVKEIHIAGHSNKNLGNENIFKIDTHDNYVCKEVWELYSLAIKRFGVLPTLLEWDNNIPDFNVLASEIAKARLYH